MDGAKGVRPMVAAKDATPAAGKLDKRKPSKESVAQFQALLDETSTRHLYSNLAPQMAHNKPDDAARADKTAAASTELTALLRRFCSGLYVDGESRAQSSRMLLTLDAALPGAAAEFIREGAFLRVRLHANTEAAFRVMSAERDALDTALGDATPLDVVVEIVRNEERHDGSTG